MTDLAQLLSTVRSSEFALDSSKLRGAATKRADAEGLVKIARYNRTVGYLASPAVVEELVGAADELARTRRELPLLAALLSTALKLGIAPEAAVESLLVDQEDGAHLHVEALATLIEQAADDLDAAAVARQRLQMPDGLDLTLDQVASELGLDLGEIRAEVHAGTAAGAVREFVSALNRVYVLPAAVSDIRALPDPQVQRAVVAALVEIERDLEFGRLLEARGATGDLRGCRKVYVDKPADHRPRFRVVYWCAPSERRPRQARILAVGARAGLGAYQLAAGRYNGDRQAQGLPPVEVVDDRSLGIEPE